MNLKSYCIFLSFSILIPWSALRADIDNSFNANTYYKMGIPKTLKSLRDYEKVGDTFYNMAIDVVGKKQKDILPKYDSDKSRIIFSSIFNNETVENIITSITSYEEKQLFLLSLNRIASKLWSAYAIQSSSHNYDDELARIKIWGLFSGMRSSELLEEYLSSNKLSVCDITDDKFALFVGKTKPCSDLCGSVILSKNYVLDDPTMVLLNDSHSLIQKKISKLTHA
jgi:hypothetical protein